MEDVWEEDPRMKSQKYRQKSEEKKCKLTGTATQRNTCRCFLGATALQRAESSSRETRWLEWERSVGVG